MAPVAAAYASWIAVSLGVLVLLYVTLVRPRTHNWGATPAERRTAMPGDDIVQKPFFCATRVVTVHAAPEDVWPWLVQIGSGRAGWYTYDWIDNAGKPSSDRIIPALQHLGRGDLVPMVPGGNIGVWVEEMTPCRSMLWWDRKGKYTWAWTLTPIGRHRTRLATRLRANFFWGRPIYSLLADVGDFFMTRKMLLGIKTRAEDLGALRRNLPVRTFSSRMPVPVLHAARSSAAGFVRNLREGPRAAAT